MRLHLDRDSVAMGDDVDPHDEVIDADGRRPISLVIGEVAKSGFLPSIFGGQATWLVRSGRGGAPLAVVAQQWTGASLVVDEDLELSAVGESLYFEYLVQDDPREAVDRWRGGA